MKEISGFDKIIYNDNACTATKTIPATAVFFDGHYPGNPIFPGVFQLELAVEASKLLLESLGNADTTIKHIKKYRFLKIIYPGQIATIKLKYVKDIEYGQEIDAAIFVEDERVSYGTFALSTKQEVSRQQFLDDTKMQKLEMGFMEVSKFLPHRYPFVHVDAIIELIPGQTIKALKNISANDYVFWGKDPGTPFPPLMMIEVFSQGAGRVCCFNGVPLFGVLSGASFLGNAYPGDQMIVEASVVKALSDKLIITGHIKVGDQVIFRVENVIAGLAKGIG